MEWTYLLKQCAAVSTQQLLSSVAPQRSRPSPRGDLRRSDTCQGQPPLEESRRLIKVQERQGSILQDDWQAWGIKGPR